MKKFLVLVVLLATMLVACAESAYYDEEQATGRQQQVYVDNQPLPQFDWSLERDVLIQLYIARNEALSTYTVVTSNMGNVIYECPSIGYPIAADTQLTNPLQVYSPGAVVEQPEPNGLYSSKNTAGTWVMCVLEDGSIYPYYTENNANTWPFPVEEVSPNRFAQPEDAKPSKTLDIEK